MIYLISNNLQTMTTLLNYEFSKVLKKIKTSRNTYLGNYLQRKKIKHELCQT
jgi:hypothetical protein